MITVNHLDTRVLSGGDCSINSSSTVAYSHHPPPICGFSFLLGKANQTMSGEEAERLLRAHSIDINEPAPFQHLTKNATFEPFGVVKLGNIPFAVTAQEVLQFIYRLTSHSPIKKHVQGYPTHIIMEKPTGKTMDCFVEFSSAQAATECVKHFEAIIEQQSLRLGTRHVCLDLSNQAELLSSLFPRARSVEWDRLTGKPTIQNVSDGDAPVDGYRGYFTAEEIFGVVKFAEAPSRSPFVAKCHQRVYESMISTLYKFPWAATNTYTIRARNVLFSAVVDQLALLVPKVSRLTQPRLCTGSGFDKREIGLSHDLLMDLMFAGLNSKGFSMLQRQAICQVAGQYGSGVRLHDCAGCWPFQTLEPDEHATPVSVKFWLELYDTGYDIAAKNGLTPNFEEYCKVSRNAIGFPIVEWTVQGLELKFSDAMAIERAVLSFYIEIGRQQWALERNVTCFPFGAKDWDEVVATRFSEAGLGASTISSPEISPKGTTFRNDDLYSIRAHIPPQLPNVTRSQGNLTRTLSDGTVYGSIFEPDTTLPNRKDHCRSKSTSAHIGRSPSFSSDFRKDSVRTHCSSPSMCSPSQQNRLVAPPPTPNFGPIGSSRPFTCASYTSPIHSRKTSHASTHGRARLSVDHTIHEHENEDVHNEGENIIAQKEEI